MSRSRKYFQHSIENGAATVWREVDAEFGLLRGNEVGVQLSGGACQVSGKDNACVLTAMLTRKAGKLLSVSRKGRLYYPAFQIDTTGQPRPVMQQLVARAGRIGLSDAEVLLWMVAPTTWWGDDSRPVDNFETPDEIVASFEQYYGMV